MTIDIQALLIKALHGALLGIAPAIGIDIHTVYNWATQDKKKFTEIYDWRISLKRIIAGAISGAFGNPIVGSIFGVNF